MLYINARQNGKAIKLKESSNYYLRFKNSPKDIGYTKAIPSSKPFNGP